MEAQERSTLLIWNCYREKQGHRIIQAAVKFYF